MARLFLHNSIDLVKNVANREIQLIYLPAGYGYWSVDCQLVSQDTTSPGRCLGWVVTVVSNKRVNAHPVAAHPAKTTREQNHKVYKRTVI